MQPFTGKAAYSIPAYSSRAAPHRTIGWRGVVDRRSDLLGEDVCVALNSANSCSEGNGSDRILSQTYGDGTVLLIAVGCSHVLAGGWVPSEVS
jgi:hypothetical protein